MRAYRMLDPMAGSAAAACGMYGRSRGRQNGSGSAMPPASTRLGMHARAHRSPEGSRRQWGSTRFASASQRCCDDEHVIVPLFGL
jgi:hypothetical protein